MNENLLSGEEAKRLIKKARELTAIFIASRMTATRNLDKEGKRNINNY